MKMREIIGFEIALHARRVSTWIFCAIVFAFTWRIATEGYVGIASDGGFLFNGPFVIAYLTVAASLMGLLVAAAIAGDAAARDLQTRMHPLFYAAPISKREYLGGRFLAVFAVNSILMLSAPIALVFSSFSPGIDPEVLGPFRPAAYILSYITIAVPNAFVATAFMFSIAALAQRAMAAYIGSVLLFTLMVLSSEFLGRQLNLWTLARLFDPFGMVILTEMWRTWTPGEKSTALIGFQSSLLINRLLWMGIAATLFAIVHARFRFAHPVARAFLRLRARNPEAAVTSSAPIVVPRVHRASFGAATHARQARAIARESFRTIVGGWGGLVVAGMTIFLMFLVPALMSHFRIPLLPTTEHMTAIFTSDDLIWLFIPLLIVFYSGEMVWRERDAGISEIADAAPVPEAVSFLGKFLGLTLALVTLQIVMMATAILIQAIFGYYNFEIWLYVRILFGIKLVDYLLFATLAWLVHVLVDHKYVGHLIAFAAFVLMVYAPTFGIEHSLFVYGSDPGWDYSDLRGFGSSLVPYMWFKLFWAAWAMLFAVAVKLLWVRGKELGIRARLDLARRRFTRQVAMAAVTAVALILSLGGFVFYNTNVLNEFETDAQRTEKRAEYERLYSRYQAIPQPMLAGVTLRVEIYPERRGAEISGSHRLINANTIAVDTVLVTTAMTMETSVLRFDREATRVFTDETYGHRVYVLGQPLQPGDSMNLEFAVTFQPRGFTVDGIDASVTTQASYFEPSDWLPRIGYQAGREIDSPSDRKAHGLPPKQPVRRLEDGALPHETAGRITFDAIVGTDSGQTALAPGTLRRSWTENGRRYFHYVTDVPISNDYAIFSAAYAVRKARWKNVDIEIYHHPAHNLNVDRMVRSVQVSLEYLGKHFGPYPHRQIRFVEHASDGNSLHSFPVNISFEEGFSLFNPEADERNIDFPFAVVAHEVAHQWWGHVVRPAKMEGGALLTESLAWFSAIGIVEQAYGTEHMERLMSMLREANLAPRSRAAVPLLRAHDWFNAFRKGPFAMYALREYVGEDRVNVALRRMVDRYGDGQAPLPTSLDLYRELQAVTPDSRHGLLADLFETNTFWSFETTSANATQTKNGTWQVAIETEAQKVVVDTAGVERSVPIDDLVEIGVYAAAQNGTPGETLYLRMHRVRAGERTIVTVPKKPARAGIDPRSLLIEIQTSDNVVNVD